MTPEQRCKAIIDKMFEIAGHDVRYEDVVDRKDDWYKQYTMTTAQCNEWMKWGVEFIKKEFRGAYRAKALMAEFNLVYGLKIEDNVSDTKEADSN